MHLTERFFLSKGSRTILLSTMGFVLLTYAPKPLTPDSQRISSTIRICSTFSTETHTANTLSPSPDLIQSPIGLLLTWMNPWLETITLDHCSPLSPKQTSAVPYPQSPKPQRTLG